MQLYGCAVDEEKMSGTCSKIRHLSTTKKPHVGIKSRFIFNMMGMMQKKWLKTVALFNKIDIMSGDNTLATE